MSGGVTNYHVINVDYHMQILLIIFTIFSWDAEGGIIISTWQNVSKCFNFLFCLFVYYGRVSVSREMPFLTAKKEQWLFYSNCCNDISFSKRQPLELHGKFGNTCFCSDNSFLNASIGKTLIECFNLKGPFVKHSKIVIQHACEVNFRIGRNWYSNTFNK